MFVGKRLPHVLAAVSADGCLRLWNVKLAQLLAEVKVSRDSLTAVCVDPAQTHLVAADSAGFMYTYSIDAWKGGKGKQAVRPPLGLTMVYSILTDDSSEQLTSGKVPQRFDPTACPWGAGGFDSILMQ